MTDHNLKASTEENSWTLFTDLLQALSLTFHLADRERLLLIGKFDYAENQELESTKLTLVSKLDPEGFSIKEDHEIRNLNFLERVADFFPAQVIGGVVWFYQSDDVIEPNLFLQNLFKKNGDVKSFTVVMKASRYSLEDIEKIQYITELVSLHMGQLVLSGQFSRNLRMEFNFDQFKIFSDRESKFTLSMNEQTYFITHWGYLNTVIPTLIDSSDGDSPDYSHDQKKDLAVNDLELLRVLKSRENEILDLKNQLRSIAKLVEVRGDNTVGMKFKQTEESMAKELLLDPPRLLRFIFKYMPKKIQDIKR